ncbi:MAG: transporter substrate-binding domain-containing protein [Thermodesulfobacteriota bacterium]
MTRLRLSTSIVFLFCAFCLSPFNSFSAEHKPGEVVVVALRNFPPHYLTNKRTGKPDGFAIDIMNKVAELSHLTVRYAACDNWPQAFEALESRKALIAPNLGITDERLALYDFTTPYETFRISIVVRSATDDINGLSDLAGRKVGVVEKNQGQVLMRQKGGSDLLANDSIEEAFMALLSGQVDAMVCPEQLITEIATRSGLEDKIRIVEKPLQEIKRGIAVIKGQPELFYRLEKATRKFIKTDEFRKIYEKWYGEPKPFWTLARVIILTGIILALTTAGLLTWRYKSILRLNRYLAEAEERFRGIVEKTTAGYFFIDTEGRFRNVNPAWLKMHGYDSPDEVIGQPFTLTQMPGDLETAQQNVARLLSGNPFPTGEFSRRCKDGSMGYHTFSAQPVIRNGRVAGLEGFIIDTSESKRTEEQTRQLQKAESLTRMAGAVAHHFNNQLSAVLGNLEIALEDLPREMDVSGYLREAIQAGRNAAEVSGLMLTYLGQSSARLEPLDLAEVCRSTLPMLREVIGKDVSLEAALPSSTGPVVKANEQLRQLLKNIVLNAAETSTGGGTIRLTLKTVRSDDIPESHRFPVEWSPQEVAYACLNVQDSGSGIAGRDIEQIFDPFYTTKFTGRGLGLPVALGIVKSYNGCIAVASEPGQGSVFQVFLPLSETVSLPAHKPATTSASTPGGSVLLIEDEERVRAMVTNMLAKLGYTVLAAGDGREGLETFQRHRDRIRIVLCDLTMPRMNGWETMAALRAIDPGIPIVLTSGHDETRVMQTDHPERPQAFLHKPYRKEELRTAFEKALAVSPD